MQCIVLRDGKLVEEGTHDELIQNGKEYKKLYEIQFSENTTYLPMKKRHYR
ncbi:MAG TPA: hypothetical protein VI387_10755 [Candidatus Brocadiales bacterium]|nr:hypothetical protein [Candidatus Brocadiales bacterium]